MKKKTLHKVLIQISELQEERKVRYKTEAITKSR